MIKKLLLPLLIMLVLGAKAEVKPKYMWFDCEANYKRLSYPDSIAYYLNKVKKTGFTQANVTEQWYSDMFLENASFFRLDDVNLGYTFRNIAKREGFNIRVAASVQNVFVITDYSGMDPEGTGVGGIDNNIWPRPRTYSLRLNVNF